MLSENEQNQLFYRRTEPSRSKCANNFQSVLIWGRLQPVTDTAEKLSALRALAEKYSPGIPDNEDEIQHSLNYVFMTKLVPEWITGKQAALEVREAATTL